MNTYDCKYVIRKIDNDLYALFVDDNFVERNSDVFALCKKIEELKANDNSR